MARKEKLTPEQIDRIWELRNEGKTHAEIAEETGATKNQVAKRLN